jgi:hypothetical protein
MNKCIKIWVSLKRVTNKIRSACGPIIKGRWEKAELAVSWIEIGNFWGLEFLEGEFREGEYA